MPCVLLSLTMMPGGDRYVHFSNLRDSDVLAGRGAFTDRYPGNVRFRTMVADRKSRHAATDQLGEKNRLVFEVWDQVQRAEGRFLRRIDPAVATHLGCVEGQIETTIWEPIEGEVALEKIKQAFRDIALGPSTLADNRNAAVPLKRQRVDSTASRVQPALDAGTRDDRKQPPRNSTVASSEQQVQPQHQQRQSDMFSREWLLAVAQKYEAKADAQRSNKDSTPATSTAGYHIDTFDRTAGTGKSEQSSSVPRVEHRPDHISNVQSTVVPPQQSQFDAPHITSRSRGVHVTTAFVDDSLAQGNWRDTLTAYEVRLPQVHQRAAPPLTNIDLQRVVNIWEQAMAVWDGSALHRVYFVLVQMAHVPTGQLQLTTTELGCLRIAIETLASLTNV